MGKSISILIVNDKPSIRQVFLAALGHSYSCLTARGVDDALPLMRSRHFEVIITEASLPDCSGLVLLLQARKYCPDAQVVIITGEGDREFKDYAMQNGVFGFLHKPYTLWQLEAIVERAHKGHNNDQGEARHRPTYRTDLAPGLELGQSS